MNKGLTGEVLNLVDVIKEFGLGVVLDGHRNLANTFLHDSSGPVYPPIDSSAESRIVTDLANGSINIFPDSHNITLNKEDIVLEGEDPRLLPFNLTIEFVDHKEIFEHALRLITVEIEGKRGTLFSTNEAIDVVSATSNSVEEGEEEYSKYLFKKAFGSSCENFSSADREKLVNGGKLTKFGSQVLAKWFDSMRGGVSDLWGGKISTYIGGSRFREFEGIAHFFLPFSDGESIILCQIQKSDEDKAKVSFYTIEKFEEGGSNVGSYYQIL